MRIAHIIMAHKNPAQLERLIEAMYHPNFDFYIHLDKKVNQSSYNYLSEIQHVNFIHDRTKCNWGGFSFVVAILKSISHVLDTSIRYDFINLLSAQDYPVKPIEDIYNFYSAHKGSCFVSYEESDKSEWWKKAEMRYKTFHFTDMNFRGKYFIQSLFNKLIFNRKFPYSFKLYGGSKSTWWTITHEFAVYLIAFFNDHPKLSRFLKLTWGSDEYIIATILMNSPFAKNTINENYRYIVWPEGEGHPVDLTINDHDKIISSGMLFARKFDLNIDTAILDKLDKENKR